MRTKLELLSILALISAGVAIFAFGAAMLMAMFLWM